MWILLIEDEDRLATSLRRGLEEEGYVVDVAADGERGLDLALTNGYDVLIVDWRLPGRDGRSVVEHVRTEGKSCPVLMLTALGDIDHKVAGLDAGADDYLSKPFSFEELLARLRALLRRPPLAEQDRTLAVGPLVMDASRRRTTLHGTALNLRPKEYALLQLLLRNAGAVLSRTVISERVWGNALYVSDNAIDVTISSLRQKLEDGRAPGGDRAAPASPRIETIRGVGYRLALRGS